MKAAPRIVWFKRDPRVVGYPARAEAALAIRKKHGGRKSGIPMREQRLKRPTQPRQSEMDL